MILQKNKTILLINDRGFHAGAGIATLRQAQSFLAIGYDVALIHGSTVTEHHQKSFAENFKGLSGTFLGTHPVSSIAEKLDKRERMPAQEQAFEQIKKILNERSPDLVIFANLHGSHWPVTWLKNVQDLGYPVVAYMHDLHYLTGRCAHPMGCPQYDTGCNENCPHPNEYPAELPQFVAKNWQDRNHIFQGSNPIPLIGNSSWTTDQAKRRFPQHPHIHTIHLGLDELVYAPQLPHVARGALQIPAEPFVVMIAAVSFDYRPKGGPLLLEVIDRILEQDNTHVLLVGECLRYATALSTYPNLTHYDRLHPENMPLAYSAADLYVIFSSAESFGQTALEAAACATPIIAQPTGGLVDITRDKQNALIVSDFNPDSFSNALQDVRTDIVLRRDLGRKGRQIACTEFSLDAQAAAWEATLQSIFPDWLSCM